MKNDPTDGPCPHVKVMGQEAHMFMALYRGPKRNAKPDDKWVTWVQIFGDG